MADSGVKIEGNQQVVRAQWGGRLEFLMSCIATSVGLGNVWRFPYTAYQNGGGTFLIPYIIVLFVIGKPFYYFEAILGQFTNRSCVKIWAVSPIMKGIGYGQAMSAFYIVSYYAALMAIILFYLIASFQSELPWKYCRAEWGDNCYDVTGSANTTNGTLQSSAELYFFKVVLKESDSIEYGIGLPSWKLALCLGFSWLCIFTVLSRGVKSAGKFSYFLAMFPYVIMIGLLIRALTLPGSGNGILFFITPDWSKLWDASIWYAAITQCFFSLSVCVGAIIMYSSYNDFGHRIGRDVMIVTTLDTFTSLIAGCTIFGILGNLAYEMGTDDVSTVTRAGTGIAFISYPEALSRFTSYPQFFSVVFFVMMFVLGTGTAVALSGAVFSTLCDSFPKTKPWIVILIVSIIEFCVGLVYITPGGQAMLTLVDYYGGTLLAIVVGVAEVCTIFWIYGLRKFLNDVEFMTGTRPGIYWRCCWLIVTPGLMLVILIYTFASYVPITYDSSEFPTWAYAVGWSLLVIAGIQFVYWMGYELVRNRSSSIVETFKRSSQPSAKWGPCNPEIREKWRNFVELKDSNDSGKFYDVFFK